MHRVHQSMPHRGSVLLIVAAAFVAGCSAGDDAPADRRAAGGDAELQPTTLQASSLPSPGVVLPSGTGATPFRASGRVVMTGSLPFAQPMLRLDDGRIFLLTGPERAACIRLAGRRVVLRGNLVGGASSAGVRGVVAVTGLAEVSR